MTIDELIEAIKAEYNSTFDGCPPLAARMCRETLGLFVEEVVIGLINHHRPALVKDQERLDSLSKWTFQKEDKIDGSASRITVWFNDDDEPFESEWCNTFNAAIDAAMEADNEIN